MFTGLIEEIGYLDSVVSSGRAMRVTIRGDQVMEGIKVGDSISTNGVCLTVIGFDQTTYSADVMPQTMQRTNLGSLKRGEPVNLERAMRAGDRFGGHIVAGHVDGIGWIRSITADDNATVIAIRCPTSLLKYIVNQGSIAVDGTSLTVVDTDHEGFRVSLIPQTKADTALLCKSVGSPVNLECDMLGKFVERLLKFRDDKPQDISMEFLKTNGFI